MMQEGNWTPTEFSDSAENHNGEIEGDELNMTAGFMEMEFGVRGSKYEALVEDADVDSNGRLNVQEFMTLMGSLRRAGNFTVTAPPGTGLPSSTEPGSGQPRAVSGPPAFGSHLALGDRLAPGGHLAGLARPAAR